MKHYKIKPLDNGGYFIATNQTFANLPSLVMAYSSKYIILYMLLNKLINIEPFQKMLLDFAMF